MSPLFSVTKFLSKTRSKAKKGNSSSRAASLAGDERNGEKTPLPGSSTSQLVVVESPAPLPAEPKPLSLNMQGVESSATSISPAESFKTVENTELEKEERAADSLGEHGYAVVQQPAAKSSEVEWTQVGHDEEGKGKEEVALASVEVEMKDMRKEDGRESFVAELKDAIEKENQTQQEVERHKEELRVVAAEKERLAIRVRALEDDLMKALDENITKISDADRLRAQVQKMKVEIETLEGERDVLRRMGEEQTETAKREKADMRQDIEEEKATMAKEYERKEEEIQHEAEAEKRRYTQQSQRDMDNIRRKADEDMALMYQNIEGEKEAIRRNTEEERTSIIRQFEREREDMKRREEEATATMQPRFEREKEVLRREVEDAKEGLLKEIQRLKVLVGVEKHRSQEKAKDFVQEKDDLVTKLEGQQDHIASLVTKLEVQQERIAGLEARLDDSREETRELYAKHEELEGKVKRSEDDMSEEHDRADAKEDLVEMLEMNNANISSQLVQLQVKVNETERQNEMLMDQVRQQADQLQGRSSDGGRFGSSSLSGIARGLRRGACGARAEGAVKALKLLNDEIYQVAASLTDQLEDINKRLVVGINGTSAKAEYLKSVLGLELVKRLERDAPLPMEDTGAFFIQAALQGCLTACSMHIITSWYPTEWEYGRFLEALYERIRGAGGLEMALSWRKTTQQNCLPAVPKDRNAKLVDFLMDDIRAMVEVCGWSRESGAEEMVNGFRQKLFNIVALAIRLNTLTAAGVPGELEPILAERGCLFNSRKFVDDSSPDRSRTIEMIQKDEQVICAVGLGLRWADNSEVDMPQLLLKPRVLLDSALG